MHGWYATTKRCFDFVVASFALGMLLLPMGFVALMILSSSGHPVFFKSLRIGKDGTKFYMIKFRTMHIDTPNVATDRLSNSNEHITGIGAKLRKYSLDEFPQLYNIIKGEMSFVGPRPALYNQTELIEARKKKGIDVLLPGLTGYAQINGRDLISLEEKVNYDDFYLRKRSFGLDLKIIVHTAVVALKGKDVEH